MTLELGQYNYGDNGWIQITEEIPKKFSCDSVLSLKNT